MKLRHTLGLASFVVRRKLRDMEPNPIAAQNLVDVQKNLRVFVSGVHFKSEDLRKQYIEPLKQKGFDVDDWTELLAETTKLPASKGTLERFATLRVLSVETCDVMIAVLNEPTCTGYSSVIGEIGTAIAFKKPIFLLKDDGCSHQNISMNLLFHPRVTWFNKWTLLLDCLVSLRNLGRHD